MTDWFHEENVVILPMRPVLRPIANNGDISVISFFRIDPTQPMKKQPTILTGRSMNSGLLLAVKPAMSGPNKISKPNLIITPRMLNVAREGRAETINPMVGPWLFFAVL